MMLIWSRWYGAKEVSEIAREAGVSIRYLCDNGPGGAQQRGAYGGNIANKLRSIRSTWSMAELEPRYPEEEKEI